MKANEILYSNVFEADIFALIDAKEKEPEQEKSKKPYKKSQGFLHSETVPIADWKVKKLDRLASKLGVLIKINGIPFGDP